MPSFWVTFKKKYKNYSTVYFTVLMLQNSSCINNIVCYFLALKKSTCFNNVTCDICYNDFTDSVSTVHVFNMSVLKNTAHDRGFIISQCVTKKYSLFVGFFFQ